MGPNNIGALSPPQRLERGREGVQGKGVPVLWQAGRAGRDTPRSGIA